jgi:hypothetical protein
MTTPTPFLMTNFRSGTPSVRRANGGSETQVANTFGTAESPVRVGAALSSSKVAQFKGSNTLYAFVRGVVHKTTTGVGAWSTAHSMTSPTTQTQHYGPCIVAVNGVQTMVVISAISGGSTHQAAHSTDGTTWVNKAISASLSAGTSGDPQFVYVWRNKIYWTIDQPAGQWRLYEYDPATDSYSVFLISLLDGYSANSAIPDIEAFNGGLYLCGKDPTPTGARLIEFTGAGFTTTIANFGPAWTGDSGETAWCLVTDGTLLFAFIIYGSSVANVGFYCFEISSSFTTTDRTTTVLPVGLRGGAGNSLGGYRMRAIVDQEVNQTTPNIYLAINPNGLGIPGTAWDIYKWNGNAALIGVAGAADHSLGDSGYAMPFMHRGGGQEFWTLGQRDIEITTTVVTPGIITISFVLYSTTGTDVVDVDITYNDEDEIPKGACTLQNPSAGSMSVNQIQGLTADNSTVYTVDWDVITDALPSNSNYGLVAKLS